MRTQGPLKASRAVLLGLIHGRRSLSLFFPGLASCPLMAGGDGFGDCGLQQTPPVTPSVEGEHHLMADEFAAYQRAVAYVLGCSFPVRSVFVGRS